ncbi:hypothetical protein N0V84_005493 [Fusarium piperis]|uniref:Heterokaryon incompatibility domain-containing protein n=1 Tax=Fusarium piperis TaxID=1435070 RepID=A0A9W9BQ77_9HYPO|nr:hypothetical protein N0V84_005493 [Fusarium piperis]
MESTYSGKSMVALILPLKGDYETALKFLDDLFTQRSLPSCDAECTLGKVGPHHVVLVTGPGNTSAADSAASIVPILLKEYPSICASLLVGVGAIAPSDGLAQAGNIVVGLSQSYESGLIQFDAERSQSDQRLHVKGLWRHDEWRSYFDRHMSKMAAPSIAATPAQDSPPWFNLTQGAPVIRKGRVGSSSQPMSDPMLIQELASDNNIVCFERAAAEVQERPPFVVVCGVVQGGPCLPRQENASKIASAYAMFLVYHLKPLEPAGEHGLGYHFIYQPLNLEGSPFRLLRLHCGTENPIKCSLFKADLDDSDSFSEYEALWYARSDSSASETIEVDGRIMAITASLHDALQHLRYSNKDRIVWEDSICIDQSNIMECGHQVAQMGTIYKNAENAIVWLGSVDESDISLLSALGSLQQKVTSLGFGGWQPGDERWKQAWEQLDGKEILEDLHLQLTSGLMELTQKPWFTRVRDLKEMAKEKRAEIHYSSRTIGAECLALIPWLLGHEISQQPPAVLDILPTS